MKRAPALAGVLLVLAACGGTGTRPSFETVQGVVLEVNGDLEGIESFVLRTDDGEIIEVVPAPDGDFRFPPAHLHDHRRTLEPLSVGLDRSVDPPLAVAIRDAGSPAWHTGESHAETTTTPSAPPTTEAGPGGPVIDLVITDGSVDGGVRRVSVRIGETVTLRVDGNTSGEVHVHGYDLYIHLDEGQGQLTFEASIPGVFEVELERDHTLVLQLEVS
ncbi:MAG: hypothetical protein J4G11_01300 [Acidimicrobiia bacterium]|nr:hypothetical protein [Acidimicrobiia bacterium]